MSNAEKIRNLFVETENRVETVISQLNQVLGDLRQIRDAMNQIPADGS